MPDPGILHSKLDVKLVTLYALKCLDIPVPLNELEQAVLEANVVNYFEYKDYFDELMASGHIDLRSTPKGDVYFLTRFGLENTTVIEDKLPFTVRERLQKSALHRRSVMSMADQVNYEVETADGVPVLHCFLLDGQTPILELKLQVASPEQGDMVGRTFRDNATLMYERIVRSLTEKVPPKPRTPDPEEE